MFLETDLFLAIRDTRKMDRCVNPQRPPLGNSDQFNEHWESILNDLSVTVRAVQIGDELAGCISCFKCDGQDSIGYWIGRDFWGRRIATQALSLLLGEVSGVAVVDSSARLLLLLSTLLQQPLIQRRVVVSFCP